jgi:hypothetical protein
MVCLAATSALLGAAASPASAVKLKLGVEGAEYVLPGEEPVLLVTIQNVDQSATASPITFTDTTGPGLRVAGRSFPTGEASSGGPKEEDTTCEATATSLKCMWPGALPPGGQLLMAVKMKVNPLAVGILTGAVTVTGGSGETFHTEQRLTVGSPGAFGFSRASAELLKADGSEVTQAGADPADFTTSLRWKSFSAPYGDSAVTAAVEHAKDVTGHLPPGLIGNPSATPALCTTDQLSVGGAPATNVPVCPTESQVGIAHIIVTFGPNVVQSFIVPLYNMVAPYGVATELGFRTFKTNILLQASVRTADHGIDVTSYESSTSVPFFGADITVWGVPTDPSHDRYRGQCMESVYGGPDGSVCTAQSPRRAFLRMPTSCSGEPLEFGAESNSYEHPDTFASVSFTGPMVTGCNLVPFAPSITVQPTGTAASSPTGVNVKLSMPQSAGPDGLAEADLKKAIVTLPEGMAINPSSADGLQACDDGHLRLGSNTPADCPDGSKIGTVLLHTQLIPNPIEGSIYVRTQNSSDPSSGEMFRLAIELRDDSHGLDFKLPGQIQANPRTGRLTTTFDENPQFPFEDITLQFKSGARAPLVTPASCSTQRTEANLYPWARPDTPVTRSSSFTLTSGAEGTPCVAQEGFSPGFNAGVSSVQAGGFTPFLVTFTRKDSDQSMQRVSVKMPEGLLGSLVGLPLCGEAQANAGTCSQASEIGSVMAGAGAGPTPFYVTGGHVYMTGPYEGAPFGLSVVVPAKAGPFDLGTVVVRSKVEVDSRTARLTVTTDPLPQIVGGVPVNLRLVNVTIDRPSFTYNPTDCDPSTVSGTITGGQGALAAVSNRFQVTNCGALSFKPKFAVTTSAKTSRANGASLDAKLSYPKNLGQANIARVRVSLPKQLPSRLTTLQKACAAQTFETNPAACSPASRIGTVTATTPVLPVTLAGPVYFVSHGGEAFPDLVIVLQGYGVTVDLVGTTFISKAGITSTAFKTVPDVPVGSFELKLPQGPYSALAANGDLCKTKLKMPTAFIAQDGAEIHQTTVIKTAGCTKSKARSTRLPGGAQLHRRGTK